MPTQVARWVTEDGKEFPSEEMAKAHENTVQVIRKLRARSQGASENNAVYTALFDAFLNKHITPKDPQ